MSMVVIHSSFACEPLRGSEPEVGWCWMLEMSKHYQVVVLTRSNNQPVIEAYLKDHPELCKNVIFRYFDLSEKLLKFKKRCNWLNWYYLLWQWNARKQIRTMVTEYKADLVHLVTFASFRYPVFLGGVGVPVVWGPVGGGETASWSLLTHRTRWRSWPKEMVRNLTTGLSSLFVRWINPCKKAGGKVIASTPRTQEILIRKGIKCEMMPTIGLSRSMADVKNAAPIIDKELRFLFVGRLVVLKGVHLLIEALSVANIPNARLTIVGDGVEKSHLQKLALKLGVDDQIHFMGHVEKDQLDKVYMDHHVLVAPSLYESGGYMVLEALMHERPAIVSDVGGLAISVDEQCGIKVALGSAQQVIKRLAEAMLFYRNSPEKIIEHGAFGKMKCEETYGWDSKGNKMAKVYESVVVENIH